LVHRGRFACEGKGGAIGRHGSVIMPIRGAAHDMKAFHAGG
jgi:hypothetical protein